MTFDDIRRLAKALPDGTETTHIGRERALTVGDSG